MKLDAQERLDLTIEHNDPAFIVHAVCCHSDLLEALRAVAESNISRPDLAPVWKLVYAAIAKAEGRA